MGIDQRLLAGMQHATWPCHMLDRDHLPPLQLPHQENAGIDRTIAHYAINQFPKDNGASAAIAFRAAFLAAGQPFPSSQPLQQRRCRRDISHPLHGVIEQKCDVISHARRRGFQWL